MLRRSGLQKEFAHIALIELKSYSDFLRYEIHTGVVCHAAEAMGILEISKERTVSISWYRNLGEHPSLTPRVNDER
jgi:hypothetical protein